jgi:quercetin dioxygenase-like cupin family protein
LLLEVIYPAGVSSPEHTHGHDSFIYLLSGNLISTVNGQPVTLEPGDTHLHAAGVRHSVVALTDSHWLEFKSAAQIDLG